MEKVNVVLVVLNREFLKSTLNHLDFDKVNLAAIFMDDSEENFQFGGKKFPVSSFALIHNQVQVYKDFIWLISGYVNGVDDVCKMKRFLMTLDVSSENIVEVEMTLDISPTWLANLRHLEEHGADFFATGNEYMRDGLNLKNIPCVNVNKNLGGVNLADSHQNLRQSYFTAKYVFEHFAPGIIKFVLIGLTPDFIYRDNGEDFFKIQDYFALDNENDIQPDLNFDEIKISANQNFPVRAALDWNDITPSSTANVEKNIQLLRDYIELCLTNGAKPIGVVFPFAPALKKSYDQKLLSNFRESIRQLEESYDFTCFDMFELNLDYDCFCDMTHLNLKGTKFVNPLLSFKLYQKNLIPLESFFDMNYHFLHRLLVVGDRNAVNEMLERIFKISAQRISRKNKIKLGFVVTESAQWCGDDLYNFFANDKRFETTVFLSTDSHKVINELVEKDFARSLEQLKSHGLNVVAVNKKKITVPPQDVLIYLTPYLSRLAKVFKANNVTLKTLILNIPYSLDISMHYDTYYNKIVWTTGWKVFFSSVIDFGVYKNKVIGGMPRGLYSGYPRMDIFFKNDTKFEFEWKMARPDAKKIIWAPHHSITGVAIKYATFQWNYQFMYEFAKEHPEISWVVKPHPYLLYKAVKKVFPSSDSLKKYLQKWDDLPNAQVYTGAYYQAIFATSDGMIHDSGSFIAEYQYVDKPMIYLTREEQWFNDLGKEILGVSYLVDGKDFKGIAETMQKVFIDGNDDKAEERRKLFDKYLNYPKTNGMLASEFIYKNIADELKEDT